MLIVEAQCNVRLLLKVTTGNGKRSIHCMLTFEKPLHEKSKSKSYCHCVIKSSIKQSKFQSAEWYERGYVPNIGMESDSHRKGKFG